MELLRKWDCNVPTLRFDFDGIWNKIHLYEITNKVSRKAPVNSTAPIRMISYGNGFILQSDKYSRDNAGESLKKYTLLKKGEMAYNHGASKNKKYGVCYSLKESDEARIPFVYHAFQINRGLPAFWNYALNISQIDKQLKKLVSSGARMDGLLNISYDDYMSISVYEPCVDEQAKISAFLSVIDKRIAVQNKIIEDLKVLKKELCKVILNNKGWPKFRIRDIANLGRGRVINTDEINSQRSPIYPVYSSQTSNNGIMGYLDQYDFEGEYITWTTDGANAGTVFYRNGRFNCTNVCGTLKLTVDFDYYITALSIQMVTEKYVSKNLANPKLMNNVMAEIEIFMPDIQTQKSLSSLFISLDKKIESAGELLSCFVSEKKFLLNAIFI